MDDTKFIAKLREKLADTDTVDASQERVVIDCRQLEEWYRGRTARRSIPGTSG